MNLPEILRSVAVIVLIGLSTVYPGPAVSLYLQTPTHAMVHAATADYQAQKLEKINNKTPHKLAKTLLKGALASAIPGLGGFCATYAGYVDYSTLNGHLSFPLRHADKKLYLLISPDFSLISAGRRTIAYTEIPAHAIEKAALYELTHATDSDGRTTWKVTSHDIPQDRRLSPLTLTLLTHPKNVVVEEGLFQSHESTHLLLPRNIYVVGNNQQVKVLLKSLDSNQYLEQITFMSKEPQPKVEQELMKNN